ncbi:MAG TPA: FkbM family methyltransferase [Allosphingosinicella sp.]|uniref:FkbM family methyltransferase n=1 Tax=Allosphingosinicella sp. TaxID=2823234 RepID=UPI002F2896DB
MKAIAHKIYDALPLKRRAFQMIRSRVSLPESVYRHLGFRGEFDVQVGPGASFKLMSHGFIVENELFWAGFGNSWEAQSLRIWACLARTANCIVDIGANTGVYSLTARSVNKTAEVVSFEPVQRIYGRLNENIELNRFRIRLERKAVSDRQGVLPIYDSVGTHSYSASLEPDFVPENVSKSLVDVVRLDEFVAEAGLATPDLLKIDVEGHEPAVLRGMSGIFEKTRPAMLIEVLDDAVGAQLDDILQRFSYLKFGIDEQAGLRRSEKILPMGGHNWNNLLCTQEQFERSGLQDFLT